MGDQLYQPRRPLGLFRSYGRDLRTWIGKIESNYIAAIALMAAGLVCLIVSAGIAISALFFMIETRWGTYTAYATVGGAFFLLGVIGVYAGAKFFKKKFPPLPSLRRQTQSLQRSTALAAVARLLAGRKNDKAMDPVTQTLAGLAAALLIGWVAASYVRRSSGDGRGRQ